MSFDLTAWLCRSALPCWGTAGFDSQAGSFIEGADLSGLPLADLPRRVMVQARQIFVFAEAHGRGWYPGGELAERAGDTMVRTYFGGPQAGWIFSVGRDGSAVDDTRDFYAHAFVLFALASLARLTGSPARWLALADETLLFMDTHMATPSTGGYNESVPLRPAPRRQNPHMHLLEALLALDEIDPGRYHRRADAVVALMRRRFVLGSGPALVEYFDEALEPLTAPPYAFEPGHHFEWAFLLARHARGTGDVSPPKLAATLHDMAMRFGFADNGLVLDEVDGDGRAVAHSTRLWPITEAIRALSPGFGCAPRAYTHPTLTNPARDALLTALNCHFLEPAPPGCWLDHLAADGRVMSSYVPASSLYHLMGAACALEDSGASNADRCS